jgi:GTP cyclohydrolase I
MNSIARKIKERIVADGGSYLANDNISKYLLKGEIEHLQKEVEQAMQKVLEALVIDTENDHNTNETAKRVAKMYITEVFKGRYQDCPAITYFPNAKKIDSMYVSGPITIRSCCSHHLAPFIGEAWVGVCPGEEVVGLSKFNRLIDWVFSRPQIQEEAIQQIADILEQELKPKGLGVIVRATHHCMTWRGVKDVSKFTTSELRGCMRNNLAAREEFLDLVRMNDPSAGR